MSLNRQHLGQRSIAFLSVIFLFACGPAMAATYTCVQSGNWNSTTTWTPTGYPVAGDVVNISGGLIVSVNANAACNSLTVAGGGVNIVGPATLTVSGGIIINRASTNIESFIFVGVGGALNASGQTVTINGGSGLIPAGDLRIAGVATVGAVAFSGTLPPLPKLTFSGSGTLNINLGALGTGGSLTASTGTINFCRAGTQTIYDYPYFNLTLSDSGTKQSFATTINGDLTVSGTVTAFISAGLDISGNLIIVSGATLSIQSGGWTVTGATTVSGTLQVVSSGGAKIFNGDVTINSGGTWNNNDEPITFAGSISNAGTFTAGTGVQTLTGTSKTITGTLSIPNLTVDGTYANNGTLTVVISLLGSGALTNRAGSSLIISGTSAIATLIATAQGNTVEFNRPGPQTIYPTDYNNLTISMARNTNNVTISGSVGVSGTLTNAATFSSGNYVLAGSTITYNGQNQTVVVFPVAYESLTITGGGTKTVNASFAANGTIRVLNGTLDLTGHTLTLGGSALLSETSGNLATGGLIATTRSINNPSSNNIAGLGAELTTLSDLGSTTITRGSTAQVVNGTAGIKRYFDITPTTNSGLSATLVFHYDASEMNGVPITQLCLFSSIDSGKTWTNRGGTVDTSARTVTLSGIASFSRWTLGNGGTTAVLEPGQPAVSVAASGVPRVFSLAQNYPNPFRQKTTIHFTLKNDGLVTLKLFDLMGHEVAILVNRQLNAGIRYGVSVDGSVLSPGTYICRLTAGNNMQMSKLKLIR